MVLAAAHRPRVLIVTASMGAGHVQVATELARRLGTLGVDAPVLDVLELAGTGGARLRATYRTVLARTPALYDAAMRTWARHPAAGLRVFGHPARAFERPLADALAVARPDAVVATWNLAAQALGRLVARGEWTGPLVTLVTDPGAHPYWVTRAAALHIAPLARTAAALEAFGAPRAVAAWPVLRPQVLGFRTGTPPGNDSGCPTGAPCS